ncbi:MAG: hypothetical protein R6V61_07335, partial [Wenzhouxiangellaceae bacterium]
DQFVFVSGHVASITPRYRRKDSAPTGGVVGVWGLLDYAALIQPAWASSTDARRAGPSSPSFRKRRAWREIRRLSDLSSIQAFWNDERMLQRSILPRS